MTVKNGVCITFVVDVASKIAVTFFFLNKDSIRLYARFFTQIAMFVVFHVWKYWLP